MSRIIFKVSGIDFIFRDPFGLGLEGDELEHQVVHGLHAFKGGKIEELPSFFFFGDVHDRFHKLMKTALSVRN